ncbi:MAG: tetratricopeptide repeat protein [Thermoplasmata archaeon]|nr:MAG: tetratricopeptide repeat protein [Thermoplasmata archaeon]
MVKKKKITAVATKERFTPKRPKYLLESGNDCILSGKEAEAIAHFRETMDYLDSHKDELPSHKTDALELYKDLGQALIKVNRLNDALKVFEKALHLEPRNVDCWALRGKVLVLLTSKMHSDAVKSFDTALKIEPKDKKALDFKGEAYEGMNRPDLAKECYLSILEYHPNEMEFYDRILRLTPEDTNIWVMKGKVLSEKGKFQDALECYDQALKIDTKDKDIWAKRAEILGKMEDYDEATLSFKKGIELDDKDKLLWKGLGSILHLNGSLKEAQDAYENAIKLDEEDMELWNNKGLVLFEMEKFEEAVNDYEKALSLAPDNIPTLENKKKALMALPMHEDVLIVCDRIIELDSKNIQAKNDKGSVLLILGRHEEAIELFNDVLALEPRDLKTLINKKQAYWNLNQLEEVLKTCETILELFPNELDTWIDMGYIQEELGDNEQAVSSYDKALEIESENLEILIKKKNVLKKLDKYEEIINTCERILGIESKNTEALEDKGASLVNLKRSEEAIDIFDTLLEINPDNLNALFNKGVALSRTGAYEEAVKYYDYALKIKSDSKDIFENKGDALKHLENYEDAVSCYDKALALDENDVNLWDKRGKILLAKENYQEVLVSYEKAFAIDPENPEYPYLKGLSLEKLDRNEEALESFDLALVLNERYEDALLGKGLILVNMKRDYEGLDTLNKVLDVNSENFKALDKKREVLKILENFKELDITCDKILALAPNNARAWEDKAYALTKLGKHDNALSAYDKALALEPENLKIWIMKKDALKILGKNEDVVYTCDKILAQDPKNIDALRDCSEALEKLKRYERAIKIYDHILDSHPKDITAFHNKARALVKLKRYEESIKCYDKALDLGDNKKALLNDKGIVLTEMEEYESAIKCFDSALNIDSEDDNILTNKALTLYKAHMYDGALEAFNRAIELNSGKTGDRKGIRKGIIVEIKIFSEIVNYLEEGDEKKKCLSFISSAKEELDKDNYIGAHGHIVDCKNIVNVYREKYIKTAEDKITTLREMEGDTSKFDKMLSEVKSLPKDKNYPEALSVSKKIMQDVGEQQHNIINDLITGINDDMQLAKDFKIDVLKEKKMLAKANEIMKKKEFSKVYRIIIQTKEVVLALVKRHKELSEAISSVKDQIEEEWKKGVDLSGPIKKIKAAEEALEAQDFDSTSKKIEECKSDIKQLTTVHLTNEKIIQIKEYIDILRDLMIDTSDIELQLNKSIIYLEDEQYENAYKSAQETIKNAERICNSKISEMLSSAYSRMIEAKRTGIEAVTVEVLIQKARDTQEQNLYKKAAKYTLQSLNEIEEIKDESLRAANIINLTRDYIQEAENIKADVTEAEKLRIKALSELENNEYIISIELSKKCIRLAKREMEKKVSESIDLFQSMIDKSKSEGKDVIKANKLLTEAKIALEDQDFTNALKLAMESESELGKSDIQKKMVSEILNMTNTILKKTEGKSIESKEVKALLSNATSALENDHYAKALGFALQSNIELLEATKEYDRAQTTLSAALARMKEGTDMGVDIKLVKELFEDAKKAFDESKYSTAIKVAKETIRKANQSYEEHLQKPIESCEKLILTAESLGVDVSRAVNMVSEAKAALKEGFYLQVSSFTESSRKLVEKEIRKNLFEKLFATKAEMESAKKEGIDITHAMVLVESAETSLENKEYIDAVNYFQKLMKTYGAEETKAPIEGEKSLGEVNVKAKKERE